MDFELSLSTNPRFSSRLPDSAPDPVASILEALKERVTELGCPECCSGFPLTFVKESADLEGGGTIIGNGFKLKKVMGITDDFVLAEGGNGVAINIGKLSPGETIDIESFARPNDEPVHAALLVGREGVMSRLETLEPSLRKLAESPQFREKLGSFDAIGFAEFPLVLRTNDPLIT